MGHAARNLKEIPHDIDVGFLLTKSGEFVVGDNFGESHVKISDAITEPRPIIISGGIIFVSDLGVIVSRLGGDSLNTDFSDEKKYPRQHLEEFLKRFPGVKKKDLDII